MEFPLKHTKVVGFCFIFLVLAPRAFSQQATVTPSALSFASQIINLLGSGLQTQTVTLTNNGNADLIIASVVASGGYKQTNTCSTLSPHQSCTIEVTFSPGTLGAITGAVTIIDNTPSSPHVVSLNGTGIAPVQLSPGLVNFGTIAVGSSSPAQSIIVKAVSNAYITINQISASGNFAQVNNCPSSLQSGHTCTIQVVFQPTTNKSTTGALAVSTVIGTTPLPFSAALTGIGSGTVVSQIAVQPATLNFGNKGPDLVDSVRTVTLSNTSSNTVTIDSVSLSGSPNAVGAFPLYKINSNTCAGMLFPGAQCKIQVAFSTTFSRVFPESYPAALTITDSDSTSPQVIGISGKQVAQLTLRNGSVVFPPESVGTTTTKRVTLTGNDVQNGLLLDMMTSGDFSVSGDLTPCLLHIGGTCTMNISFTPTQFGLINGAITMETYPECNPFPLHQCSDPVVLNLEGTGQ